MARGRRGRRGGRGKGTGGLGQAQVQQPPAKLPVRDLEAEARTVLHALERALGVARSLYGVTVLWADDHELRTHRYDDVVERRLPLAHPDALLAVGCTAPFVEAHGPTVRLARRVLERLSAETVRPADVERGEMLVTALLGVAASVAARHEAGRAGRFGAGRVGDVVAHEQIMGQPVCAACLSAAEAEAWRARMERGQRRAEVERALRSGDGVFISRQGQGGRPRRR